MSPAQFPHNITGIKLVGPLVERGMPYETASLDLRPPLSQAIEVGCLSWARPFECGPVLSNIPWVPAKNPPYLYLTQIFRQSLIADKAGGVGTASAWLVLMNKLLLANQLHNCRHQLASSSGCTLGVPVGKVLVMSPKSLLCQQYVWMSF